MKHAAAIPMAFRTIMVFWNMAKLTSGIYKCGCQVLLLAL